MCCSGFGDCVGPAASAADSDAGFDGAGISSATNSAVAATGAGACTLGSLGALANGGNVADELAVLAPRPARH